jgi:membrane protease YdiL (CAAX protease family)
LLFRRHPARLACWCLLVGVVVALAYASRATGGKPPRDYLYTWSAVANGAIQYAVLLAFLAGIAIGVSTEQLGLRRPRSWWAAVGWCVAAIVAVFVVGDLLNPILHPGREQGLTPAGWDGHRAAEFAANFVVIALVAPVAEELTFRGAGFGLIAPYVGRGLAIVAVGLAFGLAHGLVEALPILVFFGIALAWLRSRTESVYPGMVVHACWNSIALLSAVHWFHAS